MCVNGHLKLSTFVWLPVKVMSVNIITPPLPVCKNYIHINPPKLSSRFQTACVRELEQPFSDHMWLLCVRDDCTIHAFAIWAFIALRLHLLGFSRSTALNREFAFSWKSSSPKRYRNRWRSLFHLLALNVTTLAMHAKGCGLWVLQTSFWCSYTCKNKRWDEINYRWLSQVIRVTCADQGLYPAPTVANEDSISAIWSISGIFKPEIKVDLLGQALSRTNYHSTVLDVML